jgi:hypothetical protein
MKTKMLVFSVLMVLATGMFGQSKRVRFGEGLKKKLVSFTSKVHRIGETKLALKLKNHSKDSLLVDLENGRIFDSDQNYQPVVCARSKVLAVGPNETKEFQIPGYCGNASAACSPEGFEGFVKTRMGPEEMVKIFTELQSLHLDDHNQMQSLVWMFTNGHQLSSIYTNDENSRRFVDIVSKTLKINKPNYSVAYKAPSEDSQYMFTGVPEKINAAINYTAKTDMSVDVVITDRNGKVIQYLKHFDNIVPGEYAMEIESELKGVAQGNYFLQVRDDKGRQLHQTILEI